MALVATIVHVIQGHPAARSRMRDWKGQKGTSSPLPKASASSQEWKPFFPFLSQGLACALLPDLGCILGLAGLMTSIPAVM